MPTFPELIRSEEELLKRLLLVSQRQLEIVEEGNVTLLMQLLGQWQQLWNEFELLEQQLAPYKGIPPERRVWKSAEERQLTESALNRCKELLEKIMENYEKGTPKLEEQRDVVKEQLDRVQRGRKVATVYERQSQPPGGK